jgi:hypothetical protein
MTEKEGGRSDTVGLKVGHSVRGELEEEPSTSRARTENRKNFPTVGLLKILRKNLLF